MRSQGAKRFENQYRLDKKQTITDDCEERKILMKILSIFFLLITASICFAGEPGGQAGNGIQKRSDSSFTRTNILQGGGIGTMDAASGAAGN